MLTYVAHPYNRLLSNRQSVEQIVRGLVFMNPNITYISPIHTFGFLYLDVSYDEGMNFCYELLSKCDSAIFCKNWETSKGCRLEMEFCIEHGIKWEEI